MKWPPLFTLVEVLACELLLSLLFMNDEALFHSLFLIMSYFIFIVLHYYYYLSQTKGCHA